MKTRLIKFGLAALAALAVPLQAAWNNSNVQASTQQNRNRLLTTVTDKPVIFWTVWWVDGGEISDWAISNTCQGGVWSRHPVDERPYDWTIYPSQSIGMTRGSCGEYPKGSEQFYNYAWGLWVGSKYPTGKGKSPNVSKGAYACDMGAMACPEMSQAGGAGDLSGVGLNFSDGVIPKGSSAGVGARLFADPGTTPLSYQMLWPFADTTINKKRRAIGMPTLDPKNGDIVSNQDTYACAGDWIPVGDAACIWILPTGAYDVWGQGLRWEQRTYCWNYDYNNAIIFINYKIRNMNDFPLDSVYFSFFMDNDIGRGGLAAGDDGYWDDLIGFDEGLNMGYTYDANGSEAGWVTPAGYIGAILLETPGNNGLTGLETWQNAADQQIDNDGTDSIKYVYMTSKDFVTWDSPTDVRMLMNSGPYLQLKPNEEVSFTVAVIVAYSLDQLKARAKIAQIQYENGYFGYTPPPNPQLNVIAGDSTVYLSWSAEPEKFVDPMSKQQTFEGYRVYRSLSGLSGTWQLLADYDLMESKLADTCVATHSVGPSKTEIKYEGLLAGADLEKLGYGNNTYTITFQPDTSYKYYVVYDIADQKVLNYNPNALTEGGFCILTGKNGSPKPLPADTFYYPYHSGDIIFIDGAQFSISDGTSGEPGAILSPVPGDQYTIKTYASENIGGQNGIRHYYIDENVKNGQIYYYSVASYSRPQPTENVGSLEGGKSGQTYWAVPRSNPIGWQDAWVSNVQRIAGNGNALVKDSVVSPDKVTGHEYEVGFRGVYDTIVKDTIVTAAYFKDVDEDSILLDNFKVRSGALSGPVIDGVLVQVAAVSMDTLDLETQLDTLQTGWLVKTSGTNLSYSVDWPGSPGPISKSKSIDVLVSVVDDGADEFGKYCRVAVTPYNNSAPVKFVYGRSSEDTTEIYGGDKITIYSPKVTAANQIFTLNFSDSVTKIVMIVDSMVTPWDTTYDTLKLVKRPQTGDQLLIKTLKPTSIKDRFRFNTFKAEISDTNSTLTLDDIRVVPNPYYVRAPWDRTQYDRHVVFQYLPLKCTIRIFNTSGLLIRTIEHDGTGPASSGSITLNGKGGSEEWNLLTNEGLDCTSGLYIWQVETEDGERAWGKFAIVR